MISTNEIPIVIIPELEKGSKIELQKLRLGLTDLGFFYIKDDSLPPNMVNDLKESAKEMFDLDVAIKRQFHISKSSSFRGWSAVDEEITLGIPDHKETIDFGFDEPFQENATGYHVLRGPNLYPSQTDGVFKTRLMTYMKEMSRIGMVIIKAIAIIMERDVDSLAQFFEPPFALLRFIRYPPTEGSKLGVGQHSDYGFLTMIAQDETVNGLQALSRNGDWVPVDPIPNTFAVNIGDMLEAWSNGVLRATPHRVINNASSDHRISIPFFFEPSLEACIPSKNKELRSYGEHVYGAYVRSYPNTY
jgi:isopenicillin N synthase-like dioxygenase